MAQPVVIKSTKYGIQLLLDPSMDFLQLLNEIGNKFEESAKFFKNARLAISFEGRTLNKDEEYCIIDMIMRRSQIYIICIVDTDDAHTTRYKTQIEAYYDALKGKESDIYQGPLKADQEIISDKTVVLVGDLCSDARIEAKGNVIVLGKLQGRAYAGTDGDEDRFIVALEMQPQRLRIGDVAYRGSWKKKISFLPQKKEKEKGLQPLKPEIAMIELDSIEIKTLEAGVLE